MTRPAPQYIGTRQHQHGVALYVVSVVLMLATLLTLWASRTSLFLDMIASNSTDYQRAFEAAQAMLHDAQKDIQRHLHPSSSHSTTRTAFPRNQQQWEVWTQQMQDLPAPHCLDGLCLRRVQGNDFWSNHAALMEMLPWGVRHGSYSGQASTGHPLLSTVAAHQGAWYWIEPMLLDTTGCTNDCSCNNNANAQYVQGQNGNCLHAQLAFRITALAFGFKGHASSSDRTSTMAVIQSVVLATTTGNPNNRALRTLSWRQMQ